jgi:VCBS repeat protein/dockerin type I repeat protein
VKLGCIMHRPFFTTVVAAFALFLLFTQSHAGTSVAPPAPRFAVPWVSFNTAVTANSGSPVALAIGDVDRDGDLDVVAPRAYAGGGFLFLRNEGGGRFAQPVNFAGSTKEAGIALADLNNDGKLDVVLSDGDGLSVGRTMSIYLGNGDGTFGARQVVSLGTGRIAPIGIAAADFDGDNDVDLAVACDAVGAVLLLRNNGNGTFAAPVSFAVGTYSDDIAAGDLNGDSRPDLVVAHQDYRVSVLMNNGSGGFATAVAYDGMVDNWAGSLLPSVALADVDRDGKLDVLYGNTRTWDGNTGQIVQLRNIGGGALTRAANIPMITYSAGPTDIVAADLNGDGAPDLLAASYSGRADDGLCVMMNNGTGSFGPAVLYPAGQTTIGLAAADLNGDGKMDVLTADDYSNAVTVRLNPGNGTFPIIPQDFAGSAQFFQDAADIDGDSDLDMFTSGPHPSADDGAIMRNDGTGRFTTRTVIHNGQDGVAGGVLRDLNGDGKPDLLFNNANTSSQYDFFTSMNNGNGTFGPATRWVVQSAGWGAIDAFDIDNDGDLDVIDCEALGAPNIPDGRFFVALNNGNGTFQTPYAYDLLPRRPDGVVAGDFNHDGKLDLAFSNQGAYGFDNGLFIVLGNGNGTFQSPIVYTAGRGPLNLVTADFDHDGNLDIATLNSGYNGEGAESLTLFFGTGTGTFNRLHTQYAPYSPDLLGATGMVAGDVDRDGDLDLMTSGASNDIALYLNDGSGTFAFPYRMGTVAGTHGPIYRDFTGDGVADLAVLTSPPPLGFDGGIAVLRGIPAAPVLQSAVSRKTHGVAGSFDIALPLTATPGIECRSGGATNDYTIVMTFADAAISVAGSPQAQIASGTAMIGSGGVSNNGAVTVSGNVVTVPLTNVTNAQTITVKLNGVNGATDVTIPMSVLIADSSANGSITATDVSQTKAQVGQLVTTENFRTDVNASGSISGTDVSLVKSKIGTAVP